MARTAANTEAKPAKTEIDLDKYEYIIAQGTVEKDGKTLIRCKLPRERNVEDIQFGLNGHFKRIKLGETVELTPEWVDFIEEKLADIDRFSAANSRIRDKYADE